MMHVLKRAWADMFQPMKTPAPQAQVAALCVRDTNDGQDVLLITSRDTGRWIVPKGWPIEGLDGPGSALQEAWEEAGVKDAAINPEPVGTYTYLKGLKDGQSVPIVTTVYQAQVETLVKSYPEADERTRKWFAPSKAAEMVDEPELRDILRDL